MTQICENKFVDTEADTEEQNHDKLLTVKEEKDDENASI